MLFSRDYANKIGYSEAVDMWALGVITVLLLTGGTLFNNPSSSDPYNTIIDTVKPENLDFHMSGQVWTTIGSRGKDFIRRLLVSDEAARMTAKEALAHPWFMNGYDRIFPEELYKRAISGWKPRINLKVQLVERLDLTSYLLSLIATPPAASNPSV